MMRHDGFLFSKFAFLYPCAHTVHRHRMMWRRASACFHPFPVSEEKLAIYYKVFQASELQSRSFNLGIIIEHTAALSARCPTAPRYGCTVLRYRRCRIISNSDYSGISMFIVVHDEEPRWPGNGSCFEKSTDCRTRPDQRSRRHSPFHRACVSRLRAW